MLVNKALSHLWLCLRKSLFKWHFLWLHTYIFPLKVIFYPTFELQFCSSLCCYKPLSYFLLFYKMSKDQIWFDFYPTFIVKSFIGHNKSKCNHIIGESEEELVILTWYCLFKGWNILLHSDLSSYFLSCDRNALDGTDETQYSPQMWETVMSHTRGCHQFSNNWKVWQHWRKHRRHLLLADAVTWLPVQVNCSTSELLNFMIDFKMHGCAKYQMVSTCGCELSVKGENQLIFKACV